MLITFIQFLYNDKKRKKQEEFEKKWQVWQNNNSNFYLGNYKILEKLKQLLKPEYNDGEVSY